MPPVNRKGASYFRGGAGKDPGSDTGDRRNERYDPSKGDRADPAVHSGQPAFDPSGKSFSYIRTAGVVQPDGGEISGREQKDVKRSSVQAAKPWSLAEYENGTKKERRSYEEG